MIDTIPAIAELLKHLQQVPYLASKNLYKVADYFLELEPQKIEHFCRILENIKTKIAPCELCCVWKEKDRACVFCTSPLRNRSLLCVVETWQDLIAIEKTGGYTGVYHVLKGVICPLEGIGPEDLSIEQLIQRLTHECTYKEVILAMNPTPEGEATAAYIATKIKNNSLVITCLARGVPVGSSLESMDRLTVYKALAERRAY